MHRSSFRYRAAPAWALALSVLVAACADGGGDRRAAADSDLARDLALVQSSARAQPVFRDTALTNAPAPRPMREREVAAAGTRSRPTARPAAERGRRRPARVAAVPPPEPEEAPLQPAQTVEGAGDLAAGIIGAGAVLTASSNARVCTRSNLPGDRITATVSSPVRGANGAEIPAGSKVVLEVASINAAEPPANGGVVFRVTSVAIGDESYPARGDGRATGLFERVQAPRDAASDRKKVIGGAIAGAILGQMMGKDTRSTVIGAAAGAAAGTAAAKMGEKAESCLAAGAPVRITLEDAVVLR